MIKSFLFILILLFLTATQVSSAGNHSYAGTFQIMNQNSKKLLDVAGASLEDYAPINQFQNNGGRNQIWSLYLEGSPLRRIYSLISAKSGKAMDNPGFSKEAGTQMQQCTYNGGDNQLFVIISAGDGSAYMKNVASGLYLGIKGASKENDAHLNQEKFNGGSNQRFYFIPFSE